jgi:hypothetical protein
MATPYIHEAATLFLNDTESDSNISSGSFLLCLDLGCLHDIGELHLGTLLWDSRHPEGVKSNGDPFFHT